jgi:hypothetical protein
MDFDELEAFYRVQYPPEIEERLNSHQHQDDQFEPQQEDDIPHY